MLKDLRGQEVVLIGELHNNPISHWLELEITQALAEQRQLVLGAEMFERDNQLALTNYLQGKITAKGLDSSARLWKNYKTDYAPLPIAYDANLPGYQKMLTMMGEHTSPNMPKAQALKDATMAHFLFSNWKPGALFIHYNGSYHSEYHEGISWYLKRSKADIKITTIAPVSQKEIDTLLPENHLKADYIICVEEDMTGTY